MYFKDIGISAVFPAWYSHKAGQDCRFQTQECRMAYSARNDHTYGMGISVFWTEGTFLHIKASFYRKKSFWKECCKLWICSKNGVLYNINLHRIRGGYGHSDRQNSGDIIYGT